MTYCTITARCDGEPESARPNFPDARENYDMTEHEGHYCTHYRNFHWEHDDYDEDNLPDEPLFFSEEEGEEEEEEGEEEGEEEEVSLLWMGALTLLAIGLAVL